MATYTIEMRDGHGSREAVRVGADDLDGARREARREATDWVRGGEWGADGAAIEVWWAILDQDNEEVWVGDSLVEVEPDHVALIKAAGGDPECDHDWSSEGEGGCDENPGVWSLGGTALSVAEHCRRCGLHRTTTLAGSQRNPGQHDTVAYEQPDA